MSNLAFLAVLLTGCLVASSVPGGAAAASWGLVAVGGDPADDLLSAIAVPELLDDDDGADDDLEVIDLNEVLESRAQAGGGGVETQRWKPKLKRCKGGPCRRKCNAKGKNGACALVCVCWK
ncbi:uncharacterized protein LOC117641252 isoform X1 [Thrips palmi]|uniref:Uncharacterized protein LOC117641252 isoform X1 n=1 Tax=Thrips palmi TaxID=161013 RepID=A0A6P8Y443_THRPL|nr:uncharacterized protein LOC117641252 isoform X1 [Thrips palmi]